MLTKNLDAMRVLSWSVDMSIRSVLSFMDFLDIIVMSTVNHCFQFYAFDTIACRDSKVKLDWWELDEFTLRLLSLDVIETIWLHVMMVFAPGIIWSGFCTVPICKTMVKGFRSCFVVLMCYIHLVWSNLTYMKKSRSFQGGESKDVTAQNRWLVCRYHSDDFILGE